MKTNEARQVIRAYGLLAISIYTAYNKYRFKFLNVFHQFSRYLGELPNTYVFTKQLAEHVLWEEKGKLPIIIMRPSIGKIKK